MLWYWMVATVSMNRWTHFKWSRNITCYYCHYEDTNINIPSHSMSLRDNNRYFVTASSNTQTLILKMIRNIDVLCWNEIVPTINNPDFLLRDAFPVMFLHAIFIKIDIFLYQQTREILFEIWNLNFLLDSRITQWVY